MSIDERTQIDEVGSDALAPGSKLLSGQYEIKRYLNSGGFGITYLATDSLNRMVVIKECFPEAFCSRVNKTVRARTKNYLDDFRSIVKLFIREAHALSRLNHPSVVGVHQVFEDNETAYMALDLIDGKDLLDIIESGAPEMSAEEIRVLTLKVLDAISHVHSQDLLHRDISPDNILVDTTGHPVLIDFGAAREEASRKSRVLSAVLVVKDGYSPQEFYVAGSQQQPCSDLYALAATLSHLISGEAPPNSQARLAALASNQPDLYEPLLGRFPEYDDAFLQAIDKAMCIMPSERIQSAEDWTLMIDHSKRIEVAREKAQKDKTIDQTVMNLVRAASTVPAETQSQTTSLAAPLIKDKTPGQDSVPLVEVLSTDEPQETDIAVTALLSAEVSEAGADVPQEEAPTPYIRVTSKAIQAATARKPKPDAWLTAYRIRRIATVPVIFCAYFFYAQLMLQYEAVHAATVQPLVALSAGFGSWNDPSSSAVTVRRGIGG